MEQMADAYLELGIAIKEGESLASFYDLPEDVVVSERREMIVVDVFGRFLCQFSEG